jgi:aspartate racemase
MPSTEQVHRCVTPDAARDWVDEQLRLWRERSRRDGTQAADQRHPCVTLHYQPLQVGGAPLLLLGGMGPLAGLDGFSRALEHHSQREIVLYQACHLPCRTEAIKSEARGEDSIATVLMEGLEGAINHLLSWANGSAEMVILCNTVHHYLPRLPDRIPDDIRLHHLPLTAIAAAARLAPQRLMLLATEGGRLSGLYSRAATDAGLNWQEPNDKEHRLLQQTINRGVKGGDTETLLAVGGELMQQLISRPNPPDALLAGCTEIPIILDTLRTRGDEEVRIFLERTEVIDPVRNIMDAISSGWCA